MIIIAMVMILAVSGLVGVAYYSDQEIVVNPVNQALSFTPEIQCNVVGDCIQFNIPLAPENENKLPNETVPVDYDIEDVTETIYNENGTAIEPTESYITGNINEISYTKTGEQQVDYSIYGEIMRVQIGNIISIEGQIKILDPNTGDIVEPRNAKYVMTMDCSEITPNCSVDPVTKRGTTNGSGTFIEKIATSQSYTPALYEVEIFAISETEDVFGQKYEVTNSLFVELFK
jgi:hypothetical protein